MLAQLKLRSVPAFGVFAPAFPATGRTTIGGRIQVKARPLEETELWQRDHTYPTSDLVGVLASAGIRGEKVSPVDRAQRRPENHVRAAGGGRRCGRGLRCRDRP